MPRLVYTNKSNQCQTYPDLNPSAPIHGTSSACRIEHSEILNWRFVFPDTISFCSIAPWLSPKSNGPIRPPRGCLYIFRAKSKSKLPEFCTISARQVDSLLEKALEDSYEPKGGIPKLLSEGGKEIICVKVVA
jgi:hypothetical protein